MTKKLLMKSVTISTLLMPLFANTALRASEQECQVRVLQPITDDVGNHWQPGKVLPVTIKRDNADGGSYCASGGSCLPREVHGVAAVKLLNCRVGANLGAGDWRLIPNRQRTGTKNALPQ